MANIDSVALGKAQGTIGNITFRQVNGKTVASQRRAKSSKAPSYKAALQQARFGLMVQVFQALNACGNGKAMTHAFPERSRNLSNFNAFMKANLASPEVKALALTKEQITDNLVIPAPYIVSRGSLTAPEALIALVSGGKITLTGTHNFTTMGDFSTELVANWGFMNGDVVTIFSMNWTSDVTKGAKINTNQFIVDTASTGALPAFVTSAGVITVGNATNSSFAIVRGRATTEGYMASSARFGTEMLQSTAYTTYTGASSEQKAAESYGYVSDPYLQDSDPLH